jgi:DNA-binding protein H-NS
MTRIDLKSMSMEKLWTLHEEIASILSAKIAAEKLKLEKRLDQLGSGRSLDTARERRPYPTVYPRFRNPDPPHQTWSGRGRQPRWIRELLARGKSLYDLRI